MADEAPKTAPSDSSDPAPPESNVSQAVSEGQIPSQPPEPAEEVPEPERHEKSLPATEEEVIEPEKQKPAEESHKIPQSLISFKEESNRVGDLTDSQRNALQELRQLVQDALNHHQFTSPATPPPPTTMKQEAKPPVAEEKDQACNPEKPELESETSSELPPSDVPKQLEATEKVTTEEAATTAESTSDKQNLEEKTEKAPEEVFIWGIPLLADERSDVILLKFLRARDFKVKEAFIMMKNTIQWRKEFGIDSLIEEDLGDDLEKVVFMHGFDRDKHPVCYNVFGEFQNKELYQKTFSTAEKRMKFLRWRIQFLERSIRKLDFTPGGVNTIFQVNDLKNSPGPGKRELRQATKQALHLLQDNYPEFVAKQVFINVPWWYLAFYTMMSPFMTQRTKSKFVFAGAGKTAETLFKYVSPEQVPVQYGGLSVDYCDCNPDFTIADPVTELIVKPATKQNVEIIISEKCIIVWELRVVGWEVSYSAEFVPNSEDSYTVIIQKATRMSPNDGPVVSNSYKVIDLGKIVLTIDNPTSKKKKLLYRFTVKPL